ncbi:HhH-GPD superfamily base excision DNA repair protein [uncultured archaeon]|nr:HhH-GPD superfamily base excision DNA repair protein [uncultured archaeon]
MFIVKDFDLKLTFESGQPLAFYGEYRLEKNGKGLSYVTDRGVIRLHCEKTKSSTNIDYNYIGKYTAKSAENDIRARLGLSQDMRKVYAAIDTDQFMHEAITSLRGLRMTKSDPWEATLCYLTSQANNMKRIRGTIRKFVDVFGDDYKGKGACAKLFPSPASIAKATIPELTACGTGFRAKYIKGVAASFAGGFDSDALYGMDYATAKLELTKHRGIGDKVADCVLLFGYGKMQAFPTDVWIKRVVEHVYFGSRKTSAREIHSFAENKWGPYAGYAQQYLFWHGRSKTIGKPSS